jgi:hypothetical protein
MSEPQARAESVEPVVPGVYRWHVADERLGGRESDAYAVVEDGRVVLVDPLPVDERLLAALGRVEAIVLTAANHQRSAWRLRERLRVPVYGPEGGRGYERAPDHLYSGGDLLPGGLTAFHAPGPSEAMHVLWRARPVAVAFLSDLVVRAGDGPVAFLPAARQEAPHRARASLRRLLDDLPFTAACLAHGAPLTERAREALVRVLDEDGKHEEQAPAP